MSAIFEKFYSWLAQGTPWQVTSPRFVVGVAASHPTPEEEARRVLDALSQTQTTLTLVTDGSGLAARLILAGYSVETCGPEAMSSRADLIIAASDTCAAGPIAAAALARNRPVWTAPPIIAS